MIYISKHNLLRFTHFLVICILMTSCDKDEEPSVITPGCADPNAFNYNPSVNQDDESCCYIAGCMDSTALNYNINACYDDNSCVGEIFGCMNSEAINYNPEANTDDGSCEYPPGVGCMDEIAINYDATAIEPCNDCCEFKLDILFHHLINQDEIVFGNDNYYSMGLNTYSVRRILYVLSDITLYFDNNTFSLDDFIFVNTDDATTLTHTINNLPAACTGISFRLGFSSQDNIDNAYLDSPNQFHNNMLWPNLNGTNLAFQGGYHYMKLEGKYLDDSSNSYLFYNTHTGPTNATDFSVVYPQFYFSATSSIIVKMNIDNWYNNPQYIMSNFSNGIMSNITAQELLQSNGLDVFSVE